MSNDVSSLYDDFSDAIPYDYEPYDEIKKGQQEATRQTFLGQVSRCTDTGECFHFCDEGD